MVRLKFVFWVASLAWMCLLSNKAKAQNTLDPALSTGSPTSAYLGTEIETVDTSSGNLRISIPLLHLPGRGLDLDLGIFYNSKVWTSGYLPPIQGDPSLPPGPGTVQITKWGGQPVGSTSALGSTLVGWNLGLPQMGIATRDGDLCTQFDQNGNCLGTLATATWQQDDGTLIVLSRVSNDGGITHVPPMNEYSSFSDGNFALLTDQGLRYKNGLLGNSFLDSNGVWHQSLEDTNGNLISCTASSISHIITGCADTLGRTIGVTSDPTFGYPQTMTYLDSTGISRTITFSYTTYTVRYPFGGTTSNCIQSGGAAASLPLLTGITLANNLSYRFEYLNNGDGTTTGEITKILLPTGGYVRYAYDFAPLSDNNFLNGCGNIGMIAQDRMVVSRFVSPDGTAAAEQPWQYNFSMPTQLIDGQVSTVMKVTDPLHNSTSFISGQFGQGLVNRVDYTDANGKVLKTLKWTVELGGGLGGSADPYGGTPRYKSQTTILADTNQQAQVTFSYGPFNNVTEKDETDWGAGEPGPILRKSTFSYLNDFNSAYAGDNVHILDRERTATICDEAGAFCSQTTTDYDTTALMSTSASSVVQHDYATFSTTNTFRGNPTQISRFLNTTGGNVITTNLYNDVDLPPMFSPFVMRHSPSLGFRA